MLIHNYHEAITSGFVLLFSHETGKLSLKMDQDTKMSCIILEGIRRGVKMAPPIASLLVALAVARSLRDASERLHSQEPRDFPANSARNALRLPG